MKTLLTILLTVFIIACTDGIIDSPGVKKDTIENLEGFTILSVKVAGYSSWPTLTFWLYDLTDSTEIENEISQWDFNHFKLDNNNNYKLCYGIHISKRFCRYLPHTYKTTNGKIIKHKLDGDTIRYYLDYEVR